MSNPSLLSLHMTFLAVLAFLSLGLSGNAADGPSSQQEAEAWLEEVLNLIEDHAGIKIDKDARPKIKRATPKEAGAVLGVEFIERTGLKQVMPVPEPEAFGKQFLARFSFDTGTIFIIPENLERIPNRGDFSAVDRMHLLKIVVAYACDLALLNSHVPLADAYYLPADSDARMAQRAVWEGHARLAQEAVAKALGAEAKAKLGALVNTFAIAPEIKKDEELTEQTKKIARVTTMGRVTDVGAKFVAALRQAKGPQTVLDALRDPPHRTSDILAPDGYLNNEHRTGPTDQDLGEGLARTVGDLFDPKWWDNQSTPLGALSLEDIMAESAWQAGAGPRESLNTSFDTDYIAGRSLIGHRRDGKSARAAALHLFRSPAAAQRFLNWKIKLTREDWDKLQKLRFGLKNKRDSDLTEHDAKKETIEKLTAGHALTATITRTDGSSFEDSHYFLQIDSWVLELGLDQLTPTPTMVGAILAFEETVKACARKKDARTAP